MKEQIKAPEKIQQSDEEIDNLSNAEFKTLVMRMLTELVEYGWKIQKKVKAMKSEIKEMHRETTVMERKLGLKSTVWTRRKKKHSTRTEWRNKSLKKKKIEERLRNLWDIFKHSNTWIIGCQKEKRKSRKIENLFENLMKENFPNLAKEIDFQEVQEAQRVPKKLDPRKHTQSISQLHYPR